MLTDLTTLTPGAQRALRALVAEITQHDGVAPVNESAELGIDGVRPARFILAGDATQPQGFAVVDERDGRVMVGVHPEHRRRGLGTELLTAALETHPSFAVWAFGTLPGVAELSARLELRPVRELLRMEKSVDADAEDPTGPSTGRERPAQGPVDPAREHSVPEQGAQRPVEGPASIPTREHSVPEQGAQRPVEGPASIPTREHSVPEQGAQRPVEGPGTIPAGYVVDTYRPGDAEQIVAVNAAAFAHHPEQGKLTVEEFLDLTRQPWFDAAGLFVARHGDEVAGFHWTKRHGDGLGEVYVIAVSPDHEGKGLGRVLLDAGLTHLADEGDTRIQLYVEGDQKRVVAMYRNAGFVTAQTDTSYRKGQE